jgi:predicted AlkP superfamily phosphohydrolase/phosphomutase
MDALVLGVDAGTWDIVNPLMARGELPNLTELARAGRTGTLESTLPPLTGPAWASFMLGAGPGEHPYFDFKRYDVTDYEYEYNDAEFIGSRVIRGDTVWDSLSTAGYRVGVVNIPMTVPAWDVNGVMLSGFPSPEVSTTPADLNLDAPVDDLVVPALSDMSQADRLEYCLRLVESEEVIALELVADHGIDVLGINFMSSDIAQHYFWREYATGDREFGDAIARVYRRIDAAIGSLLERAGDCPAFVFSDHGAGPAPTRFFNVNSWLLSEDYLTIDLDSDSG